MAHVGTITGSMVLDPSAYIAGLNRAAQHTAAFQSSIQAGTAGINAFAKASQSMAVGMSRLNGSVYASMTAFYALSRVVSSSLGVFEEYNNIISRISATADLSISSITALSESFKKLNRELGGSRTDLMKGVYRAVQANFTTPEEFMPIGAAAMRLRTASGREIDTTKSADVISVIRNALGIKSGREGFITDMLLRGRDIGRYELTEMASALGIPITLFGNQFSAKLGPEETLRQLIAILSSATQTGLNPRTAATGTRRMVEMTTRLMKSPEGIGKNLTTALRSMGFSSISEALNQGPMAFLETISRLTGGRPEALTQMGYGSRDIMLLTSALRNNMGQTREFYGKLAPGEIGGTTDKYLDKHKQTWWYQRDRLRSAYEDSQLKLMEAMIPVLSSFANSLEVVNDLFQALAPSIKRLIGLMTIGAGFSILRNFYVRGTGGKFGAQGSDNLMKNLPVMGAGTPRTAEYYGLRKVNVAKRSAQLQTVPASQMMGPTGPLFPQRYNRRATDGRFVPRGYDIRDWRGGIVPPSMMGSPVQQVGLGRRGAMYDSASRFFGRASDNVQRFSEGYGKAKGWLKESWLGKGGAFAFGGNEYRLNRIQKMYDARIEAANKAFVSGKAGADRGADWMRDTARQSGVNPVAASRIAAQHFNSTMDQVTKNFNKATASAANTAKWMSRLSGVMSGLGSIGNLVALGGIIQLLSSFVSGLAGATSKSTSNAVVDMSEMGTRQNRYGLNDLWGRANMGLRFIGYALGGKGWRDDVATDLRGEKRKRGFIYDMDKRDFRAANMQDVVEYAIREKISVKDSRGLIRAGYNKNTGDIQNRFEKWLRSEGIEGITQPRFLQSTLQDGTSGFDFTVNKYAEFLKTQEVQADVAKKTTEWLEKMGITARGAAASLALVKNFNMTPKQTDHIVEYLKNNYREYFSRFISGAKQIETRGMLYDQQADRSLTPNEQSIWQSSGYREKMALAASGLFTPKHRFGGEDKFASFENWAKQQKENERYSGFGEYEDAKRNYFEASSKEQTASMLAVLLPKLATLSTSDARKQLEAVYGGKLNLDDVGIDRLRNTDLSRYFSEKPRDQLNSKSQFMGYGTTETYNSIVSMTPPEIIELQANRKAILDLQEAITQDSDKLLQDFDGKFEKFVADKLDKIVDNTAISANAALFGNTPDFVPSLD